LQVPPRGVLSSGVTAFQYVDDYKREQARHLRKISTSSEDLLWRRLRNRQLEGLKFRRQQVISGFVADFYCECAKLVIEVDGNVHETPEQHEMDIHRDGAFALRGLYVLRVKNEMVTNDTEECLSLILKTVRSRIP
jgi:very-short-patch-repair endonuclease